MGVILATMTHSICFLFIALFVYGEGLTAVGLVFGLHVAAMYLPSIVTGRLVDKFGWYKMVIASAVTFSLSVIMAAYVPGGLLFWIATALILPGVGWNFGLISGIATVADSTDIKTRTKTQRTVDVWVALGGSAGSLLSGIVVAFSGFSLLTLIGILVSLLLIPIMIWVHLKNKRSDKELDLNQLNN